MNRETNERKIVLDENLKAISAQTLNCKQLKRNDGLHFDFEMMLKTPLAVYYQLPNEEREKLPESAWKFLFYSISWIFVACIILFNNDCRYFHKPSLIWKDYSMSNEIPNDVYTIFVVQLSFYIHSVYATIYVDAWRKDSLVLIGHHIITSVMLLFSLSTRCHRAGLGTIFLHDMCDILLEATKTSLYFKKQANKCYPIFEMIANVGFAFIARLYWFPLRVLYNTSVYLNEHNIKVPFTFFINCLLYVLLSMNIYWFAFILNLLYKVIGGQIVEDVRDFDDAEHREESVSK
ncbi:ceramide synthase 1-like protein [Leptotrombidium deliense]|uniref:Ceramide synthase 1-like protein n=1 Tax=Leptotrombidium deliense TaxID=299467 RepID=A0A443SWR8_9ACAR|nr:ceramide synthase 1-like protein [Leptotrombidium deliense]